MVAPGLSGQVNGSLPFAGLVSVLVGLIGFLSPCVLPLVPGYLGYIAGQSGRGRSAFGAALFVAGFTALFVSEGVVFGQFGDALRQHQDTISRCLGVVTIMFGLAFLGQGTFMQHGWRPRWLPHAGLAGAPLLGFTFGIAWTPCSTPTLAAIDTLAYTEGSAARGAALQVCYCIGLGLPFLLIALGLNWVATSLAIVRRHLRTINRVGAVVLMTIGALLALGEWTHFVDWLHTTTGPGGYSV